MTQYADELIELDLDALRDCVKAIKAGNAKDAIFCLRRALDGDSEALDVIEIEWRQAK